MKDDIKLPPLPYPQIPGNDYDPRDMWDYARAAIKYDRQQRGELVARVNAEGFIEGVGLGLAPGTNLYDDPQPAEPYTPDPDKPETPFNLGWTAGWNAHARAYPQTTTPAQEPSDDRERFEAWAESVELYVSRSRKDGRYVALDTQNSWDGWQAHALLDRYGAAQPIVPEGWQLMPKDPTNKQICHMAMRITGADEDGWYRTNKCDWSKCVEKAEQAYQQALESAPKFGEEE